MLKPGYNDDEDLADISFAARLFYAVLWGFLDKQALIEEKPLLLRSKLYPREDFPISLVEEWIGELTRLGPSGRPRLVRVKWRGKNLLYCPTLKRHSRIFADEPVYFDVPEQVLKEAREACNVFIDQDGKLVDPPGPGAGPTEQPPASSEGPANDQRGTHEGPTEPPQNSHASVSVPAPAPVPASASVPAPVPAATAEAAPGLRIVDNSRDAGRARDAPQGRERAGPEAWTDPPAEIEAELRKKFGPPRIVPPGGAA